MSISIDIIKEPIIEELKLKKVKEPIIEELKLKKVKELKVKKVKEPKVKKVKEPTTINETKLENLDTNSSKRYIGKLIDKELLQKTEDGFTCCRWCNKAVKPPRRTLCSNECAHELNLRMSGKYLRDCVYQRDKGICSICNVDTKMTAKTALMLDENERNEYLLKLNISLKRKIWRCRHGGGLWDADHITTVKDGGGCSGLDNMRTLCISCHKIITASSCTKKTNKTKKTKNITK